ncbi:MAG: dihydroorotase [Alistipes sp.]
MKTIYRNAKVWRNGCFEQTDVTVEGERILAVGVTDAVGTVVDLRGRCLVPGLVDVHVHLREPGFAHKETIATGSAAAAHGGYTTVCPMPNLTPAPDSVEHLQVELDAIARDAAVRVIPYGCITVGQKGRGDLVDFEAMAHAVVAFSDDGRGVQTDATMEQAMRRAAQVGKPIVAHCEVDELLRGGYIHEGAYAHAHAHKGICSESEWRQVERDLILAEQTGCQYHVCHVSTKESVELVRAAKARGVRVSCETAPHYLLLTEDDLQEDGRFKMNPPLRSRADRAALVAGIQDGTIEVIATDHAPHTAEEKSRGLAGSALGVVGLECAFGLMYKYMVCAGVISFAQLLALMSTNPRRLFGLGGGVIEAGAVADFTVLDLDEEYTIDPAQFRSKGRATPFAGWQAQGRAVRTVVGGRTVYDAENEK